MNLSVTVLAKSALCFIATGMGYIKPTAIPPSHIFVPVCMPVVTLSLFTHTNLQCIHKSNVKCFTEHRTETIARITTNTSTSKVGGGITTGIQSPNYAQAGISHLQSIPWTAINNILWPPAYYSPTQTTALLGIC
jgi:hypothetical protein